MRFRNQRLPIGYQEVEYLESTTAGQYIDTNVPYTSDLLIYDSILYTSIPGSNGASYLINGINQTTYWGIQNKSGTYVFTCGGNNTTAKPQASVKYLFKIDTATKKLYVNDTLVDTRTAGIDASGNMYLFASKQPYNTSPNLQSNNTRHYFCKIYQNGNLIRNFIPCVRLSDSKPGLYDTVGSVFYVNIGSGEFLYGPPHDSYMAPDVAVEGTTNLITRVNSSNAKCPLAGNGVDVQTVSGDAYCSLTLSQATVVGDTYTLSFDVYGLGANDVCSFGLYSGGMKYTTRIYNGRNVIPMSNFPFAASSLTFDDSGRTNANIIHIRNFQFEKKDHATLFTPYGTTRAANTQLMYKPSYIIAEGTTNLGNTSASYSDKVNGRTESCSGWGGDAGTCTWYHSGGFNNYPYKVYHKTATGTGGIYRNTTEDIVIEAGKTYTMSIYVKASVNINNASAYSFNINRNNGNRYINYGKSFNITTDWKRLVKTFTATSDDAGTYKEMSIIYDDTITDYYIYYSGFQIEEKDHATPFVIGTRANNTII